jgi:hypothetical protein
MLKSFRQLVASYIKVNSFGAKYSNFPKQVSAISVTTCYVTSVAHNTVPDFFERNRYKSDSFIYLATTFNKQRENNFLTLCDVLYVFRWSK